MRVSPNTVALGIALAFAVACDATAPQSGAIRVAVTTLGADLDVNGYSWRLDGRPDQSLAINSSIVIVGLSVGTHVIDLEGLAENCSVDGALSRSIEVVAADTVTAEFAVVCSTLIGAVRVTARTSGFDLDPDGYTVRLDDGPILPIGQQGSLLLENVRQGIHTLSFEALESNCVLFRPSPLSVTVWYGKTVDVLLETYCKWWPGGLTVNVTTTGDSLDATGYLLVLKSSFARSARVDVTGAAVFDNVDVGQYTVTVEDLAGNCLITGGNTRTVAVASRQTTQLSLAVACTRLGDIQLRSSTSGTDPDPDGYEVAITGTDVARKQRIASQASASVRGLLPGAYTLELTGAAVNCAPSSTSAKTVTVVGGASVDALFDVACTPVTQLAFTSYVNNKSELQIVNANGTTVTRILPNAGNSFGPSWSPDGSQIVFSGERDGPSEIYVTSVSGSVPVTRLTSNVRADHSPAWSPNGAKIAFVSDRDGNSEIYVMNADGSNVVRLTTQPNAFDGEPAWSPDGSKLAFSSDRTGDQEIFVMNADGSAVTQLTRNRGFDGQPAWSPDGTKIAFAREIPCDFCYYYSRNNVFVMNANGSNVTRLASDADDSQPTWSPDGRWIAVASWICSYDCEYSGLTAMRPNGTERIEILAGPVYKPAWRR